MDEEKVKLVDNDAFSNINGRKQMTFFNSYDNSIEILRDTSNNNAESITLSENEASTTENSSIAKVLTSQRDCINIACTNARSLAEKVDSLITLFEENSLHFAILTETWLTARLCPPRTMSDLTTGANLSFIRRDRGSRGGGVAVCFDPTKIKMNKFPVQQNANEKVEIVAAVGNCQLSHRKVAAVALYLYEDFRRQRFGRGASGPPVAVFPFFRFGLERRWVNGCCPVVVVPPAARAQSPLSCGGA